VKARRAGRWIAVAVTLAAITLAPTGSSAAESVRVTVQPVNALLDAPFRIRVTGHASRQRATLEITEVGFGGRQLAASRPVQADRNGVVDLPRSGLLALVSPRQGSNDGAVPRFTRNLRVSVLVSGRRVAAASAVRFVTSRSVTIVDQRPAKSGFYAEYFRPPATSSHTAVVLLGGSNGGLANGFAAGLLASHGYPVLSLAYFGEPGLPSELQRIPLEYFQRAISWLAEQPEADPKRITVLGVSRGGEAALLIGATYPQLVRAVAAYVPSDRVYPSPTNPAVPAWTFARKPVASQLIAVEKISGPVFLVGGGDDLVWPSSFSVSNVAKRMNDHRRRDVTALNYAHAGHGAGAIVPNLPTAPTINTRYGLRHFGGTPSADAAARADSWPKLLRFLSQLR
jgi:dienelactone hydrolase